LENTKSGKGIVNSNFNKISKWFLTFPLCYATVYAVYHILLITTSDLGLTPDGLAYLRVADSLVTGAPFYVDGSFISHWPPLYSMLIAGIACIMGSTSFMAAKVLSVLTAFAFVYLFNGILKTLTHDWKSILLANIVLVGCSGIAVLQSALSESLFMVILLVVIQGLNSLISNPSKAKYLTVGCLCGLLFLTRYAGFGFILGFGVVVLWQLKSLKNIFIMAFGFVILVLPWLVFSNTQSHEAINRDFAIHLISLNHLKGLGGSIFRFFNPSQVLVLGVLLLIFGLLFFWTTGTKLFRKIDITKFNYNQRIFGLGMLSYFLFLLISISFFDFKTPLNVRMLFPLFVVLIFFIVSLEWDLRFSKIQVAGKVFISLIVITHLVNFTRYSLDFAQNGDGFTATSWKHSPTLEKSKAYAGRVIYSNAANVLNFYGISGTVNLPLKLEPTSRKPNPQYENEFSQMKQNTLANTGIVVIFKNKKWWDYLPTTNELNNNLTSNGEVVEFKDGIIYY
jgi:hypothetical protein